METMFITIIFAVMVYLFLILPLQLQNRRAKRVQRSLSVGDEVITMGGLIGRVCAIEGEEVTLELSPGVQARVLREAIGRLKERGHQKPLVGQESSLGEKNSD